MFDIFMIGHRLYYLTSIVQLNLSNRSVKSEVTWSNDEGHNALHPYHIASKSNLVAISHVLSVSFYLSLRASPVTSEF